MSDAPLLVFFYGSYIDRAVLAEVDLAPKTWEPATLPDYEIRIAPRANLVRAPGKIVYGVLADATPRELERLYLHAQNVLGQLYLPQAVQVQTRPGVREPALCYIAAQMDPHPADPAYVARIVRAAREHGFPASYLEHLESFAPGGGPSAD